MLFCGFSESGPLRKFTLHPLGSDAGGCGARPYSSRSLESFASISLCRRVLRFARAALPPLWDVSRSKHAATASTGLSAFAVARSPPCDGASFGAYDGSRNDAWCARTPAAVRARDGSSIHVTEVMTLASCLSGGRAAFTAELTLTKDGSAVRRDYGSFFSAPFDFVDVFVALCALTHALTGSS